MIMVLKINKDWFAVLNANWKHYPLNCSTDLEINWTSFSAVIMTNLLYVKHATDPSEKKIKTEYLITRSTHDYTGILRLKCQLVHPTFPAIPGIFWFSKIQKVGIILNYHITRLVQLRPFQQEWNIFSNDICWTSVQPFEGLPHELTVLF